MKKPELIKVYNLWENYHIELEQNKATKKKIAQEKRAFLSLLSMLDSKLGTEKS